MFLKVVIYAIKNDNNKKKKYTYITKNIKNVNYYTLCKLMWKWYLGEISIWLTASAPRKKKNTTLKDHTLVISSYYIECGIKIKRDIYVW